MKSEGELQQNDHLDTELDCESQLMDFERMRNDYAEKGEYENAQACSSKIRELKESIQEKKMKELEYHQITVIDDLESSYRQEVEQVSRAWDDKIAEFEERFQRSEEALTERQVNEMETLYAALELKLEKKFKFSKEYLTLERQEQQLVKFQRFTEAVVLKKKKEAQRNRDIDKWNKEKNDKIKLQAIAKSNKHLNEKGAFKMKYDIELELLRRNKVEDIRRIQKKYQNKKLELDIQQRNERISNEKEFLTKMRRVKKLNNFNTIEGQHSRSNTNNIEQKDMKEEFNEEEEEQIRTEEDNNDNEKNINDNYVNNNEEAVHEDRKE